MCGIHRSPANSPHKGQWRGVLMLFLISAWINGWVNNREAGDLRHHCAHYDVTVMLCKFIPQLTMDVCTDPCCDKRLTYVSERDPAILGWLFRNSVGITSFQHDDVIKWKHFPRNWPFVRGIHRSPVNSPHKGQWRGALMFSLICVWINDWVNNREAGDLRRYRAHSDVIVMKSAMYNQRWVMHP